MSEEQNYEAQYEVSFDFEENTPIEAVFQISPNICDLSYTHYQNVPQEKWTVTHNLGKCPSVTVTTSAGETVFANVDYINLNQLVIIFVGAFSGTAYLN